MRPLLLPPNVIDHFYLGGRRLAALRRVKLFVDPAAEESRGGRIAPTTPRWV